MKYGRDFIHVDDPNILPLIEWLVSAKLSNPTSRGMMEKVGSEPWWPHKLVGGWGADCPWTLHDLRPILEWMQSGYKPPEEGGDDVLGYSFDDLALAFGADDFLSSVNTLPAGFYTRPEWRWRWWARLGPIAEVAFYHAKNPDEEWWPDQIRGMTLREWAATVDRGILFDWSIRHEQDQADRSNT